MKNFLTKMKSFSLQKWILKKNEYPKKRNIILNDSFFCGQYKWHQCSISWVGAILSRADWKLIKRFSVNYFAYISVKIWWAIHSSEEKKGDEMGNGTELFRNGMHWMWSVGISTSVDWTNWKYHDISFCGWKHSKSVCSHSFGCSYSFRLCTLARCWVYLSLFPFLFSQRHILFLYKMRICCRESNAEYFLAKLGSLIIWKYSVLLRYINKIWTVVWLCGLFPQNWMQILFQ